MKSYRVLFAALLSVLLAAGHAAVAGNLIDLAVSDVNGVYSIRVDMVVHAAPENVYDVLTDYANIHRLNPSITESELLAVSTDGVARVRTRIEDCVLVFCVDIVKVESVREVYAGHLSAETEPQASDFDYGRAEWWILQLGDYSRVVFEASMQPGFSLPPVIGPYVMKRKLRAEVLASFRNLECIARINAVQANNTIALDDAGDGARVQSCPS